MGRGCPDMALLKSGHLTRSNVYNNLEPGTVFVDPVNTLPYVVIGQNDIGSRIYCACLVEPRLTGEPREFGTYKGWSHEGWYSAHPDYLEGAEIQSY